MGIPVSSGGEVASVSHAAVLPQKAGWLGRLINSCILLVVLSLATVALAFKWYSLEASFQAPNLPGWSWSAHPNTLLIYYPHTDCGCGPGLPTALNQAQAEHFDVAVITDVQGQKMDRVTKEVKFARAHILSSANTTYFRRWLKDGNTTMLHIRSGQVVGRAEGTVIPESFGRN